MFAGTEAGSLVSKKPDPQITITPPQVVELVAEIFLKRDGEQMTQALIMERARQVASALIGMTVTP